MKELTSILSEKQVLKLYDIQLLGYEILYKFTEAFHKFWFKTRLHQVSYGNGNTGDEGNRDL